jgi:hypothetical protein
MKSNIKKFEQKEIDALSSQFFDILISLREYILNPTNKIDINSIKESHQTLCTNGEYFIKDSYILKDLIYDINKDIIECENLLNGTYVNNKNKEENREIGFLTLNFIDILRSIKECINNPTQKFDIDAVKKSYDMSYTTKKHLVEKSRILTNLVEDIKNSFAIYECVLNENNNCKLQNTHNLELNTKKRKYEIDVNTNTDTNANTDTYTDTDTEIQTDKWAFTTETCLQMLDHQITSHYLWKHRNKTEDDSDSDSDSDSDNTNDCYKI